MIRVKKRVYVSDLSTTLTPGSYSFDDVIESQLIDLGYAESLNVTLNDSDDAILNYLLELNGSDINQFWEKQGYEAIANYLVNRAGKERNENWKLQQMGNMVEKHLGL